MLNYNSWESLINTFEYDLRKIEEDKEYCFSLYEEMRANFDVCLLEHNYEQLLNMLPYFESPASYPNLHHSGETMRIYLCLLFLKQELKHKKTPFISNCTNYKAFQTQYTFTRFALRRLEQSLSPDSVNDALDYLSSVPLNIYVVRVIVENEYFENYPNIYWQIYYLTKNTWPLADKIQLLMCIAKDFPSQKVLLELALLYIQGNNIEEAYCYLTKIQEPTDKIQSLITSLKELLTNERQ